MSTEDWEGGSNSGFPPPGRRYVPVAALLPDCAVAVVPANSSVPARFPSRHSPNFPSRHGPRRPKTHCAAVSLRCRAAGHFVRLSPHFPPFASKHPRPPTSRTASVSRCRAASVYFSPLRHRIKTHSARRTLTHRRRRPRPRTLSRWNHRLPSCPRRGPSPPSLSSPTRARPSR